MGISHKLHNINRFEHIVLILIEEDLGHLLVDTGVIGKLSLTQRFLSLFVKDKAPPHERLPYICERLGPSFIKLGQMLSVRPDLIPIEYIEALQRLQTHVTPMPFSTIKKILEEELPKPLSKIFKKIDETPLASASIAQVHRAILKNGKEVALKVQRPQIAEAITTDLEIMDYIVAHMEEKKAWVKKYRIKTLLQEYRYCVMQEIDFEHELHNIELFEKTFRKHPFLIIPRPLKEYCSKRLLVMDYIDGIPINEIILNKKSPLHKQAKRIFMQAFESSLDEVFTYGIFHADPHPGNILACKHNKLGLVDFGLIGHFDEKLRSKIINLFYYIGKQNPSGVTDVILSLSDETSTEANSEELQQVIAKTMQALTQSNLNNIKLGEVLEDVIRASTNNGVHVPRELVLFVKTLVELEGLALEYDPHFDIAKNATPYIEKLIKQDIKNRFTMSSLRSKLLDVGKTIAGIPDQANKVLRKIEAGEVKIQIQDTDIKRLAIEIDKSSNRISYATVMAALVIAGALILNVQEFSLMPTTVLAIVLFIISFILGITLLVSIKQEKNTI